MDEDLWTSVDAYIDDRLVGADGVLEAALADAEQAGLPSISVSPAQGKMLMLLARAISAKRILEIGTLAGYSTIWLARGLGAGGRIVTLEYEPKHAEVARSNFARAGVAAMVEVRVGAALDALPALAAERPLPFDLVFIDADKVNTWPYVEWALKMTHSNSMIIVDNVIRHGRILGGETDDAGILGMRRFFDEAAKNPRISTTAIQTVGSKGYDGFAISIVV